MPNHYTQRPGAQINAAGAFPEPKRRGISGSQVDPLDASVESPPDLSNSRYAVILEHVRFEFYRLRFHFEASEPVLFLRGAPGNILRGAFGTALRKLACPPDCRDSVTCESRETCAYARIFEPRAAPGMSPSGLVDQPRPFVFRVAHLDGRSIEPGRPFSLDVHLFDTAFPAALWFVAAFRALEVEGIGPGRGRARLVHVEQLSPEDGVVERVFDGNRVREELEPSCVELQPGGAPAERVRVRFVTPTELKCGEGLAARPDFPILFARIRDRLSTLSAFYGPGPLDIDFRAMAERSSHVLMTDCDLTWRKAWRRSSRTGQKHQLGGFTGVAEYRGSLTEFLPYLHAARWTGVGRQTVWGKGEIQIIE